MKRALYFFFLILFCCSCEHDKLEGLTQVSDRSLILFYPWSSNLKSYFDQNIRDFASAMASSDVSNQRIFVCIETTPDNASFIELKNVNNTCVSDTLIRYSDPQFTTKEGITRMLNTVRALAKTDTYSMIVGCHGMGWLPIESGEETSRYAEPLHYEVEGVPQTRYFGGLSNEYRIEIETLADGIADAGMYMEYILFDDCYMSSIEVAYALKDVTHHLIGCPTEIMAYGFPYHKCGKYLLGEPDYELICSTFYNFYKDYESPYGTIAVTDCTQLDELADIVRSINVYAADTYVNTSTIQVMDGYSPTIFYDFEDVVRKKCNNDYLFSKFIAQLKLAVPYKRHTQKFYSAAKGAQAISTFCGVTTSDLSTNARAAALVNTEWYAATH